MGIPNRAPIAAGALHFLIGFTDENGCGFLSGGLSNSHGQLGNGNRVKKETTPLVTIQNLEMLALSCGLEHSMVLTGEKETQTDLGWRLFSLLSSSLLPQTAARTRLYAFGSSEYGQLGLGDSKDRLPNEFSDQMDSEPMCQPIPTMVELPDPDENVIQVECGLLHSVLLTGTCKTYRICPIYLQANTYTGALNK
jgi:alpha-tubulin suppressor-like RCC1 family protein